MKLLGKSLVWELFTPYRKKSFSCQLAFIKKSCTTTSYYILFDPDIIKNMKSMKK